MKRHPSPIATIMSKRVIMTGRLVSLSIVIPIFMQIDVRLANDKQQDI